MRKSIHVLCHRKPKGQVGFIGLEYINGVHRSGTWLFDKKKDPNILVGGWIYLHDTSKATPATYGGEIVAVYRGERKSKSIPTGIVIEFEARLDAQGVQWRGNDSARTRQAVVDGNLPHEAGE